MSQHLLPWRDWRKAHLIHNSCTHYN